MVFTNSAVVVAFLFVIFLWLSIVTVLIVRMIRHYNRLGAGVSKTGLKELLESILTGQADSKKRLSDAGLLLQHLVGDGKKHIQHIGVVRFNPFADTGGSQSFTVALLNGQDDGIIMTSLYGRSGNRWYVKEVRAGKGQGFALSQEEEAAIKRARTGKGS